MPAALAADPQVIPVDLPPPVNVTPYPPRFMDVPGRMGPDDCSHFEDCEMYEGNARCRYAGCSYDFDRVTAESLVGQRVALAWRETCPHSNATPPHHGGGNYGDYGTRTCRDCGARRDDWSDWAGGGERRESEAGTLDDRQVAP